MSLKVHLHWPVSAFVYTQGSSFLKIFTCPTSKICFFQYQIIYDLEEKFVQIYLPDRQFYLPRAVGQWDMASPDTFQVFI